LSIEEDLGSNHGSAEESPVQILIAKGDENQMSVNIDAQSRKRICEKCGRHPGDVYPFYYGRKKSSTSRRQGNRVITTTSYDVAGRDVGAACSTCVLRHRIIEAVKFALIIFVCAGVGWLAYIHEGFSDRTNAGQPPALVNVLLMIAAPFGALIGLINLLTSAFASEATHGENSIIALKKGELRKQGFNSFWTTASYVKLRRR
jgi:hypothetical protein